MESNKRMTSLTLSDLTLKKNLFIIYFGCIYTNTKFYRVMNPPFGTKTAKGIDMVFLKKAFEVKNEKVNMICSYGQHII